MAVVEQDAPVLDLPPVDSSEFIDKESNIDSFEQEAEFSSPTLFEFDDDLKSDLREVEGYDAREHTPEAELDMSQEGSSQAKAGISDHSVEPDPVRIDNPQAAEGAFESAEQAVTFSEPIFEDLFDDPPDSPQPSQEAAATDPWVDPLPSWDYSQNEWPVLVGPPKRKRFGLLTASLGVLVLLAAAGFYFFILQPTLREQSTTAPVESRAPERAAASAQPDVSEAKPAEAEPRPVASSPLPETPAAVDSKPIPVPVEASASGKFSLQAAAFPTQAGADEFADKLKGVGLPSYVVSADLGRRGRWFRVRVGRFNSAEDAQKFAGEAQLRARAAGMSLQLIGSQYDQP